MAAESVGGTYFPLVTGRPGRIAKLDPSCGFARPWAWTPIE